MEKKVKFYTRRKNIFSAMMQEYLEIKDMKLEDAMKLAEILKKYGFMIKVDNKEV
ncbi:hypothetical protein [Neobacillus sp. D3-1R]|uniref:hypothetical protein n=1 Tax=Neobacillus sp. D3-1R TaxID=3445778 RepID=UPI003F9FB17C